MVGSVATRVRTLLANIATPSPTHTMLLHLETMMTVTTIGRALEVPDGKERGNEKDPEIEGRNITVATKSRKRWAQHFSEVPLADVSRERNVAFVVLTKTGAGHEFGHSNNLITVAGTLAGAFAGHKLEEKREKDKAKKKERRESGGYGNEDEYGRRRSRSVSRSRKRSGSRRRGVSSSSDESDSSRRRHRHHRD